MTRRAFHASVSPYSAIVDRPALMLPGDARMVVWTIVNVEDWGIERPMPRTVLLAADGTAAAARPAQLGMARIRHARGLLAAVRMHAEIRRHADARDQRRRVPQLSAHCAGGEGRRLGIHGSRLVAGADAQRRGSARRDPRHDRGHPRVHRQSAARLGKPGLTETLRDHRPSRRGRHRIRRRLGAGRSAGLYRD